MDKNLIFFFVLLIFTVDFSLKPVLCGFSSHTVVIIEKYCQQLFLYW